MSFGFDPCADAEKMCTFGLDSMCEGTVCQARPRKQSLRRLLQSPEALTVRIIKDHKRDRSNRWSVVVLALEHGVGLEMLILRRSCFL